MANSNVNLEINRVGKGGRAMHVPVDGGSHIRRGTLVSFLAATMMAVPGSTALSTYAKGVALTEADNTSGADGDKRVEIEYGEVFEFPSAGGGDAISEATELFSIIYMTDDHTLADNDGVGTRKAAGRFFGMSANGKVRVLVGPLDIGDSLASAVDVDITDAGGFTAATDVEAALQEIYQDLLSVQKQVNIPILSSLDVATGALLAVFADGASTTPGTQLTNAKASSVRWNNHATPGAVAITVPMPQDLDDAADVTFHALVSKIGATVGDATKLTVAAFEQVVGALHDADVDFGGDTNAVVGNAASKTVTELILTLGLADIHAAPSAITLTIKPKAGTLGTDDFCLHACWLEYKPKVMTS